MKGDNFMLKFLNNFKTINLMAGLMGLCLAIGYLIGGQSALLPALVIGAVINLFAFFFSLATFMPARISFLKTSSLLLEGPNVQIIFVLLIFFPKTNKLKISICAK